MFTNIIVGVDGAAGGQDAISLAEDLAGPGSHTTLVHAFPYERYATRGSVAGYEELLRDESMDLLRRAAGGRDDRTLRAVADPSPARALHELAGDIGADLIVVGSCHRDHALARLVLGDSARSTLHGAPCAVAIAPRGYAAREAAPRAIGVGMDGRPGAQVALDVAHELARQVAGELHLRTAVPSPVPHGTYAYAMDWTALEQDLVEDARRALSEVSGRISDVPVEIEVRKGLATQSLAELSGHVDVLVLGSRAWGTFGRVFIGSTADGLLRAAHSAIVVVPPPQATDAKESEERAGRPTVTA